MCMAWVSLSDFSTRHRTGAVNEVFTLQRGGCGDSARMTRAAICAMFGI